MIDPIALQTSQVKDNLVTQYQGKRYTYDVHGNVVEAKQANNTLKLSWDNLNRLVHSDNNGKQTQYGYDVFGRRLYKINQDQNGKDSLTLFGWDGDLMIWESNTKNNQAYTKHYVYEPNSFVPLLQGGYTKFIDLTETPNYEAFRTKAYSINKDPLWKNDTRKSKTDLEHIVFYHCDQIGTPQTLSSEKGECIWEIELNTWGKDQEVKTKNQNQEFEQTNIRFQGQYYDEETGLHYNRYRYYEPHSGKYISKDPIGLQGGLNNSSYVSDPNQWVDPLGLEKTGVLGALFPNTMSAFAKDPQQARALKTQGAMRNNNLGAVAIAGYGPYALAGGAKSIGIVAPAAGRVVSPVINKVTPYLGTGARLEGAGLTAGTVGKGAAISGAVSGGLDVGFQVLKCKCVKDVNLYQTGGVASLAAVTGAWGSGTSAAANFGRVGWLNIAQNSNNLGKFAKNNAAGFSIFAKEQVIGQTGSIAVKSATNKTESNKEK